MMESYDSKTNNPDDIVIRSSDRQSNSNDLDFGDDQDHSKKNSKDLEDRLQNVLTDRKNSIDSSHMQTDLPNELEFPKSLDTPIRDKASSKIDDNDATSSIASDISTKNHPISSGFVKHSTPNNGKNSNYSDDKKRSKGIYLNISGEGLNNFPMSSNQSQQNIELNARDIDISSLMERKLVDLKSEKILKNFIKENRNSQKSVFKTIKSGRSHFEEFEMLLNEVGYGAKIPENIIRSSTNPAMFLRLEYERNEKAQNRFSEKTLHRSYRKPDINILRSTSANNFKGENNQNKYQRKSLTCHSCKEFDINDLKMPKIMSNESLYSSNKSLNGSTSQSKIKNLTLSKIAKVFSKNM